jgi:hypothetical protein
MDEQVRHLDLVRERGENVGQGSDQIKPEGDGMQQIRFSEDHPVRQHASYIKEEAGAGHAPERGRAVDQQSQPERIGGMQHHVMSCLGGRDQYDQQRQEEGIAIDLPIIPQHDQGQYYTRQ